VDFEVRTGINTGLVVVGEAGLALPKMVTVHLSPENQQELEDEVGAVAHELGVDLALGVQDMVFKV
jgi:hypothetical protein